MTAPLAKAVLQRLAVKSAGGKDNPPRATPDGDFPVQFNPTSLKLTRQNNIDQGPATTHAQRRQNPSQRSATLTFDLEFDTAEVGTGSAPKDVRTLTQDVRQFVEPSTDKPAEPPPRVRFLWGSFRFAGIVTQLTEDLDYFAPNGTPLRAKVSLTITEQDLRFEGERVGSGRRDARTATPPGGASGTGPAAPPASRPNQAALAQAGESVQQVLSRLGADPATWRSAMTGLDSPLALPAGAPVQLDPQVAAGAGAGVGVSAGFAAGESATATASLDAALTVTGGAGATASGFALAEAGGVAAARAGLDAGVAAGAVASARASFDVPAGPVVPAGLVRDPTRPVPVLPPPDPRARTYGWSVPLRPRPRLDVGGQVAAVAGASAGDDEQRRRDAGDSTMRWTPWR